MANKNRSYGRKGENPSSGDTKPQKNGSAAKLPSEITSAGVPPLVPRKEMGPRSQGSSHRRVNWNREQQSGGYREAWDRNTRGPGASPRNRPKTIHGSAPQAKRNGKQQVDSRCYAPHYGPTYSPRWPQDLRRSGEDFTMYHHHSDFVPVAHSHEVLLHSASYTYNPDGSEQVPEPINHPVISYHPPYHNPLGPITEILSSEALPSKCPLTATSTSSSPRSSTTWRGDHSDSEPPSHDRHVTVAQSLQYPQAAGPAPIPSVVYSGDTMEASRTTSSDRTQPFDNNSPDSCQGAEQSKLSAEALPFSPSYVFGSVTPYPMYPMVRTAGAPMNFPPYTTPHPSESSEFASHRGVVGSPPEDLMDPSPVTVSLGSGPSYASMDTMSSLPSFGGKPVSWGKLGYGLMQQRQMVDAEVQVDDFVVETEKVQDELRGTIAQMTEEMNQMRRTIAQIKEVYYGHNRAMWSCYYGLRKLTGEPRGDHYSMFATAYLDGQAGMLQHMATTLRLGPDSVYGPATALLMQTEPHLQSMIGSFRPASEYGAACGSSPLPCPPQFQHTVPAASPAIAVAMATVPQNVLSKAVNVGTEWVHHEESTSHSVVR